jgi:hypothetical protein
MRTRGCLQLPKAESASEPFFDTPALSMRTGQDEEHPGMGSSSGVRSRTLASLPTELRKDRWGHWRCPTGGHLRAEPLKEPE